MNETLYNAPNDNGSTILLRWSSLPIGVVTSRCLLCIYIIFGLIGNTLNIILFTRPILFRTSSSIYLLSASVANLLITTLVVPFRLFADGFQLDLTDTSILTCRIVSYCYYVCLALPPYFTVLACADRWAASSLQVNRRRFSSVRIAKRLIPVPVIICCLLYSHIFVTFTLNPNPPPPYCSFDDSYVIFGVSFHLIIYSIIPPSLMAFFSIAIIVNVRRKRNHVVPIGNVPSSSAGGGRVGRQRRLSPMQVMLVCQAISECVLTLPYSIINLISIVVINDEYFLAIYTILRLLIFFNSVSSFYIYTLSSKLYREELKKLFKQIFNPH
jgi:hypothetical protein